MNSSVAPARAHPLAAYGLDMLARGASRLRGDRPAIAEAGPGLAASELTYRELDHAIAAFAARAIDCGLCAGDRVIVVGAARIGVVAAVLGALAAGLEPVVAPAHLGAGTLAFLAQASGATALFGPSDYGGVDLGSLLLEAAATAPDVRIVGSLGPGVGDGAVDFSLEDLAGAAAPAQRAANRQDMPRIGLILTPRDKPPRATFFDQGVLVAQALDVVAHMRTTADRPIVSLLSPASVAGLVAGPAAAMLAGAPLVLFGPFDGAGLLRILDSSPGCHLIAPAAAGDDLFAADFGGAVDCMALAGSPGSFPAAAPPCPLVRIEAHDGGRLSLVADVRLESTARPPHSFAASAASAKFD